MWAVDGKIVNRGKLGQIDGRRGGHRARAEHCAAIFGRQLMKLRAIELAENVEDALIIRVYRFKQFTHCIASRLQRVLTVRP